MDRIDEILDRYNMEIAEQEERLEQLAMLIEMNKRKSNKKRGQ